MERNKCELNEWIAGNWRLNDVNAFMLDQVENNYHNYEKNGI